MNLLLAEALAAQQIEFASRQTAPSEFDTYDEPASAPAPHEHRSPDDAPREREPHPQFSVSREFDALADRLLAALPALPAIAAFVTAESGSTDGFWLLPLATALVRKHGVRILLVEADGAVPAWPARLGLEAPQGIVDLLKTAMDRKTDWKAAVRHTAISRIDLLPRGTGDWSGGALADDRLKSLFAAAKADYPLVLIAAGTAGSPVSQRIIRQSDGVLLVVGLEATACAAARRAAESLSATGARILGALALDGRCPAEA